MKKEKIKKSECEQCKNLPEGEVVKGHDHRIKRGIIITTSEATQQWFDDCFNSIKDLGYPVLVVVNAGEVDHEGKKFESEFMQSEDGKFMVQVNNWNGFEMGGILRGTEHFDEFIHLMDTCVITNPEAIERMFEHNG